MVLALNQKSFVIFKKRKFSKMNSGRLLSFAYMFRLYDKQ